MKNIKPFLLSPSLLAADSFDYYKLTKKLIHAGIEAIHFDIMDCTETSCFGLNPNIIKIIPEHVIVDIHIMSDNSINILKSIPYRKNTYVHTHFRMIKNYFDFIEETIRLGFMPGVTFDLKDNLNIKFSFIDKIKWINFMSIDNIGLTNQDFSAKVFEQLDSFISENGNKFLFSIDGSVRDEHLKMIKDKFQIVVVGSLLYNSQNLKKKIKSIYK